MKNKKTLLRLGLLAMVMGCFGISYTSAKTSFHLNIDKIESISINYLSNKIIPIHFSDNGNDFGGFFYFSNGIGEDNEEEEIGEEYYGISIISGNDTAAYECNRQVKGFYYNAERGERLRPLDKGTWSEGLQDKITTSGGLYTVCSKSGYVAALAECKDLPNESDDSRVCKDEVNKQFPTDGDGYYGQVIHEFSGQKMTLTVGVNYANYHSGASKFIIINETGGFSPSFIRVRNEYPAGFIYDQNGGVGFVGCQVGSGTTDTGAMKTLLRNYYYQLYTLNESSPLNALFYVTGGNIDYHLGHEPVDIKCSNAVRDALMPIVIEGIVGMGQSGSASSFGYQKNEKNSKMQYFSSSDINNNTIINYARKKAELLCRGKWQKYNGNNLNTSNSIICVDVIGNAKVIANDNYKSDKTLVVKNGSVEIKPFSSSADGSYYDIFIDSGNLIIDETDSATKFVFNRNGFIAGTDTVGFSSGVRNNPDNYVSDDVAVASFIRGNFIVNGKISGKDGTGLNNKYFIHGKVSTRDTFSTLTETFKWRCKNGRDTNGDACPQSYPAEEKEDGTIKPAWDNPYEAAALVIIDQKYNSSFFNNY